MKSNTPIKQAISTNKSHINLLNQVGVETLSDLIKYFPRTYNDQSNIVKITEVRTDQSNTIKGTLSQITEIRTRYGKKIIKAKVTDDTGSIDVIWFNQPYLKRVLYNGQNVILSGKAKYEMGKTSLLSPEFESVQQNQIHTARIVPVYHETEGLSSKWLREKIHPLLKYIPELFPEYLREDIIQTYGLLEYSEAILETHFPTNEEKLNRAKHRLAFDELFLLQLKALQKKWEWKQTAEKNKKIINLHKDVSKIIKSLPFELTNAQKRTLDEIFKDLESEFQCLAYYKVTWDREKPSLLDWQSLMLLEMAIKQH